MTRMYLFTVFVWLVAMPFNGFAHGTDYRLINKNAVVAAEFFYSDKTPMRYAEIMVFSPENKKVEYQNGRTDQNGRFAFLPETPGKWQIKVDDGMGHAVNAIVSVNSFNSESKNTGEISSKWRNEILGKKDLLFGGVPMGIRAVFGVSILMNLFLGVYMWKRKP